MFTTHHQTESGIGNVEKLGPIIYHVYFELLLGANCTSKLANVFGASVRVLIPEKLPEGEKRRKRSENAPKENSNQLPRVASNQKLIKIHKKGQDFSNKHWPKFFSIGFLFCHLWQLKLIMTDLSKENEGREPLI